MAHTVLAVGVLSLSAFCWIVKDDFRRNHSKSEGAVGDRMHWKRWLAGGARNEVFIVLAEGNDEPGPEIMSPT